MNLRSVIYGLLVIGLPTSAVFAVQSEEKPTKEYLNGHQYASNGIARYEKVYGPGYISTGGARTTELFTSMLDLRSGMRVLDLGCGLGGGDFYLENEYGVEVVGLDLNEHMIAIAKERASETDSKVQFIVGDMFEVEFELESFDVVYIRDVLIHIHNKTELFQKNTWLVEARWSADDLRLLLRRWRPFSGIL